MQSPDTNDAALDAMQAFQQGQWESACRLSRQALLFHPLRADVWTLYGMALRRLGKVQESEDAYRKAIAADPAYTDAHFNLANLLRDQARWREAAHCYRVAIAQRPDRLDAFIALSDTLNKLGEHEQAIHVCQYAISLNPARPETYNNLGNAQDASGQAEAALKSYTQALEISPEFANAAYNRALLLEKLGKKEQAAQGLRDLLLHDSKHLNGWIKLGDLQKLLGKFSEAVACYQQALALKPDMAEVHNNLGVAFSHQNLWDKAADAYQHAIELGAKNAQVYLNLGNSHHAMRQFEAALKAYREGLAVDPGNVILLTELTHVQLKVCDWQGLDGLRERLLLPALQWDGSGIPPSPFVFLSLPFEVTPAEQQTIASRYSDYVQSAAAKRYTHTSSPEKRSKLKIAYVSADFHNHATAHLMLGLFSRHDRSRFEIIGYSMGQDDGSDYRLRIQSECDHFIDLRNLSDAEAAARINSDGIDIAIDLKGYTGEARPGIFAYRPAPIQVAYLGYPGTMGADFMDYVIADRSVIPDAHTPYYTEHPVLMPHSYQVNNIDQPIAPETPTRQECGLPNTGFVFCCFNSPYKIEPQIFSIWMRLLKSVPGSVLWLFAAQKIVMDNLRKEAEQRGVDGSRLVFAESLPKSQHLARHRHVDLFLDTLFYNAHTTTSDALWAGVPVVTCPGNTFASRVAASLLHAIGLPQLITDSLASYETLALELATSPHKLEALRQTIAQRRLSCPLFDTERFARDLERAYAAMWQRRANNLPPQPIYLD